MYLFIFIENRADFVLRRARHHKNIGRGTFCRIFLWRKNTNKNKSRGMWRKRVCGSKKGKTGFLFLWKLRILMMMSGKRRHDILFFIFDGDNRNYKCELMRCTTSTIVSIRVICWGLVSSLSSSFINLWNVVILQIKKLFKVNFTHFHRMWDQRI